MKKSFDKEFKSKVYVEFAFTISSLQKSGGIWVSFWESLIISRFVQVLNFTSFEVLFSRLITGIFGIV
jgi:hypothetical protein